GWWRGRRRRWRRRWRWRWRWRWRGWRRSRWWRWRRRFWRSWRWPGWNYDGWSWWGWLLRLGRLALQLNLYPQCVEPYQSRQFRPVQRHADLAVLRVAKQRGAGASDGVQREVQFLTSGSTRQNVDRIYRIFQDFWIKLNPEQSCKSCLFSLEDKDGSGHQRSCGDGGRGEQRRRKSLRAGIGGRSLQGCDMLTLSHRDAR